MSPKVYDQPSSLPSPPPRMPSTRHRQLHDAKKEIRGRSTDLIVALQQGRANETLQFFSDNAILLLPGRAAMVGKAALEDYFRKGEAAGRRSGISFTKRIVKGCGCGYAYETGQYSVDNNGTKTYGHYVTVWRKETGPWLIENQCFNVERHAPSPPPAEPSPPSDQPQSHVNSSPSTVVSHNRQRRSHQHRENHAPTTAKQLQGTGLHRRPASSSTRRPPRPEFADEPMIILRSANSSPTSADSGDPFFIDFTTSPNTQLHTSDGSGRRVSQLTSY